MAVKQTLNTGSMNRTPFKNIASYTVGEGAYSLTMNSIWAWALLFYTQVIGLDAKLAGLALSITMFWDAISDPIMGHISDNTRSRFGRRLPYVLIGGVFMAASYGFLWWVPEVFSGPKAAFWYLLIINMIMRTAMTVSVVPYTALGFEVCTDYDERSKLQSTRFVFNMIVNFFGIALGWSLFFKDRGDVEGTQFADNYLRMGITFAFVATVMILICVYSTRKCTCDTNDSKEMVGNNLKAFLSDFKDVLLDKHARLIFIFFAVAVIGMVTIASIQVYTYGLYMNFSSSHKTFVHAASMVGSGLGAVFMPKLVRKLDKKITAYLGAIISVIGHISLLVIFEGGLLGISAVYQVSDQIPLLGGRGIPVATIVFALFHMLYWGGCGILVPLAISMIADISEINKHKTGILKDGSYAAMFSFLNKTSASLGLLATGFMLDWAGFISGSQTQTPETIRTIAIMTFVLGPAIAIVATLIVVRYPINRAYLAKIREQS